MATQSKQTTTTTAVKTAKAAPKSAKTTSATPSKAVAKPAPAAAEGFESVTPVIADAQIKKPELIDRVVAETGMKKKDVKPVVEGMLAVLGRALVAGEELNLPPLGKVMVNRVKDTSNATIINVKLRHPKGDAAAPKPPLAEAAE